MQRQRDFLRRRDFLRLGSATVIATGAGKLRPAFAETLGVGQKSGPTQDPMAAMQPKAPPEHKGRAADFTLQIAPMLVELAPQVVISTIGYNNKVPGPLLRVREGQRVTVDVRTTLTFRSWCIGMACLFRRRWMEQRKKALRRSPPHGRRRYEFVAKPAGSRWYHSHTAAMMDLHRGSYTGQFGFFMIDGRE